MYPAFILFGSRAFGALLVDSYYIAFADSQPTVLLKKNLEDNWNTRCQQVWHAAPASSTFCLWNGKSGGFSDVVYKPHYYSPLAIACAERSAASGAL